MNTPLWMAVSLICFAGGIVLGCALLGWAVTGSITRGLDTINSFIKFQQLWVDKLHQELLTCTIASESARAQMTEAGDCLDLLVPEFGDISTVEVQNGQRPDEGKSVGAIEVEPEPEGA